MSGISWNLDIRETLAKHISGLCQLALLSQGMDTTYSNKIKLAVERAYSFIPQINIITNFVQKIKPSENSILRKMSHITALHGDRHKRCSPPFNAIYSFCVDLKDIIQKDKLSLIEFSSKKAVLLHNSHMEILVFLLRLLTNKVGYLEKISTRQFLEN